MMTTRFLMIFRAARRAAIPASMTALALLLFAPGPAGADARTEYFTALANETVPARIQALDRYLTQYPAGTWSEQARAAYLALALSEEVSGRLDIPGSQSSADGIGSQSSADRIEREAKAFLDEAPSDPERLLLASEIFSRFKRGDGLALPYAERALEYLQAMNRPAEVSEDEWPEALATRVARARYAIGLAHARSAAWLAAYDEMREASAWLALDERFRAEYETVAARAGKDAAYTETARRDRDRRAVLGATDRAEQTRLAEAFIRAYDPEKPHREMRFLLLKNDLAAGNAKRAIATADQIARQSESPPVFSALAFALADAGVGLDEAIVYGEKALALVTARARDPQTPAGDLPTLNRDLQLVNDALGWAHYKRGNDTQALEYLTQAVNADYPEVHAHYGLALERVGKTYDAAVHLADARVGGVTAVEEALERIRRRDLAARNLIDDRVRGAEREIRTRVRRAVNAPAMPDFDLVSLAGSTTKRSDLAGRPYIVAFWTSWCGPCGDAMPVLAKLGENGRGDRDVPIGPVRILHLTADRDPWSARAFATRNALPFEDVLFLSSDPDRQEALADALSLASLPLFLLVDANGNVAYRMDGYDGNAFAFDITVREWLKEAF